MGWTKIDKNQNLLEASGFFLRRRFQSRKQQFLANTESSRIRLRSTTQNKCFSIVPTKDRVWVRLTQTQWKFNGTQVCTCIRPRVTPHLRYSVFSKMCATYTFAISAPLILMQHFIANPVVSTLGRPCMLSLCQLLLLWMSTSHSIFLQIPRSLRTTSKVTVLLFYPRREMSSSSCPYVLCDRELKSDRSEIQWESRCRCTYGSASIDFSLAT